MDVKCYIILCIFVTDKNGYNIFHTSLKFPCTHIVNVNDEKSTIFYQKNIYE